ncbi:MAG: hypothetical protein WCP39_06965 [Chlamydiota bacterium]
MWPFTKKNYLPTVTFATTCWEKDWKLLLEDPEYLEKKQIGHHLFPFSKKVLVINNVLDEQKVIEKAQKKVSQGVLTNYYLARELASEVLSFFQLKKSDFVTDGTFGASNEWVYYNAIGVLSAIYTCETDYLLYLTGDVYLENAVDWIPTALKKMESKHRIKVANLVWNQRFHEAKKESFKEEKDFYVSKDGFSDQFFLVKRKDFRQPIYSEIRADASHFPRGDVFEKRVYSYMKNHRWHRITFKRASYIHENI